jgi:hypothetical protein
VPQQPVISPAKKIRPGCCGAATLSLHCSTAPRGFSQGSGPMLQRCWRHDGSVPEVDDDQLAALRRLRAAFGFVEVVSHNQDDDSAAAPDESMQGARMADPRRMPLTSKSKPTRS